MITTETKTIFKLPLAKVAYPEKNLIYFWKMKKEERAEKLKKAQEAAQLQKMDPQMVKEEVKIVIESPAAEQLEQLDAGERTITDDRGTDSAQENAVITAKTEEPAVELSEL